MYPNFETDRIIKLGGLWKMHYNRIAVKQDMLNSTTV